MALSAGYNGGNYWNLPQTTGYQPSYGYPQTGASAYGHYPKQTAVNGAARLSNGPVHLQALTGNGRYGSLKVTTLSEPTQRDQVALRDPLSATTMADDFELRFRTDTNAGNDIGLVQLDNGQSQVSITDAGEVNLGSTHLGNIAHGGFSGATTPNGAIIVPLSGGGVRYINSEYQVDIRLLDANTNSARLDVTVEERVANAANNATSGTVFGAVSGYGQGVGLAELLRLGDQSHSYYPSYPQQPGYGQTPYGYGQQPYGYKQPSLPNNLLYQPININYQPSVSLDYSPYTSYAPYLNYANSTSPYYSPRTTTYAPVTTNTQQQLSQQQLLLYYTLLARQQAGQGQYGYGHTTQQHSPMVLY